MRWYIGLAIILIGKTAQAHYSYQDASHDLQHSPAILSAKAQLSASTLQRQSLEHLGKPEISLNVHAVHYRQHADVPLTEINQKISSHLGKQADAHLNQIAQLGLGSPAQEILSASTHALLDNTTSQLSQQASFDITGNKIRPSVSLTMPIYTGGLIDSTKHIAQLKEQRDTLGLSQATSLAQLELIKRYFDVQLHHTLSHSQKLAYQAMQHHATNAQKLEQQGFISKGQRMQFEVARNQSLRLYQNADNNHQKALFELQSLLDKPSITTLSTPLFINTQTSLSWQALMDDFYQAPLNQKLHTDVLLLGEKVNIHHAAQKPKVFAVGQYSLEKEPNWFVGVVASYNVFSAIDQQKQAQAAQLEQQAASLSSQKATQETINLMHSAFLELNSAKTTHRLLEHNLSAAKENLRIQRLAFQEGMGTVSGVVDAEVALYQVHSETALNAYRYVLALATLLHHTGQLSAFEQYINHSDSHSIRL